MSANAKISGSWKDVSDIQAKVSGAWKTVDEGYSKISGVWKQFYSAVVPSPSSYDLLETVQLTSSASSVSFTGLGAYTDYKHLQIRAVARSDQSGANVVRIRFNTDTGNNYARHFLFGNGSSVNSAASSSVSSISAIFIPDSADVSNLFGAAVIEILDFSSSSKNTTTRSLNGFAADSIFLTSGLHVNTSAITSVDLFEDGANLVTGSRFSLYGIKDS